GRRADLLRIVAARVTRGEVLEQQVDVARDRGKDVVEVVRDAAGEPAHGLHLLGLAQLLLEQHALGRVAADAEDTDEPAVAQLRARAELDDARVSLPRPHAELAGWTRLAAQHSPEQLQGFVHVGGMHQALERLAQPLVARPTGDGLERRVEGRAGALGSQREDHIAYPSDERAVLLFAVAPRVLGAGVLRARPRETDGAGDGRRQALEVVLHDIISSAGL